MFNGILPEKINRALDCLQHKGIREIRIRVGYPIIVDFGALYFLGETGIVDDAHKALTCSFRELQDIVFKACECSVYAHNEELKMGYVTLSGGQRVGICGELVFENGYVKTLKNFSSVNIRIPHQIKNCSLNALSYLYNENKVYNTLIISPPGAGKTTFLRDLCCQLSNKFIVKNILVIDERGEIASCLNGQPQMNVGMTTDVYTHCTKSFGLENGIRTLSPEVIAMDELAKPADVEALNYAIGAGVKILATAHATNIEDFLKRPYLKPLVKEKVFERVVVLSTRNGAGTLEGIYNENQICINGF